MSHDCIVGYVFQQRTKLGWNENISKQNFQKLDVVLVGKTVIHHAYVYPYACGGIKLCCIWDLFWYIWDLILVDLGVFEGPS